MHDSHIRYGLRIGADVICEKPLVLNPWNVDALIELEEEYKNKVHTILQLRHHEAILELKDKIDKWAADKVYDIDLTYITSRGNWYYTSWKGNEEKSGGIASNIGVHFLICFNGFLDLWRINSDIKTKDTNSGTLRFKQAKVNWYLSINAENLPQKAKDKVCQLLEPCRSKEKTSSLVKGLQTTHG